MPIPQVIKLPADTCVYSMGMKADPEALAELRAIAGDTPLVLIGDCAQVGKVGDAVHDGYRAAMYAGT